MTEEPRAPVPVSRSELDRVIRRATELQFREGGEDSPELSEEELLRIGREVGLAPEHMRRALGEVRAEALLPALPPDSGVLRRLIGEGRIRADRVVPGEPEAVEERLVRWFHEAESLHLIRRRSGISLWEPAEGFVAQLQRGLNWQGQRYELAQARQVELAVQGLEKGFTMVTLTLDLRNVRMEYGAGYIAGFGFLGGAVTLMATFVLFPPAAIVGGTVVGITGGALGGLGVGRSSYRGKEERARLAAEGVLDRLERGELDRRRGGRR